MLNPQAVAGMPFPNFPIPGMFPNLLGARDGIHNRVARQDADRDADSANEREGSPSPVSGHKRMKVASGSGGSSSSKESSGMGHRDDQPEPPHQEQQPEPPQAPPQPEVQQAPQTPQPPPTQTSTSSSILTSSWLTRRRPTANSCSNWTDTGSSVCAVG